MADKISRVLIANRGEIAIRIARAVYELGLKSVGIFATEDRLSLHRFKVDEAFLVGAGKGPVEAYLDQNDIVRIALENGADAVHPGYGFLSENPEFADLCEANGIKFIGPTSQSMRILGNKVSARKAAIAANVPVIPATDALPEDDQRILQEARRIGLPVMLKASWGGGGRGMRVIKEENELLDTVKLARQEASKFFGKDEVYFEKLVTKARHVEVQVIGDSAGNVVHLYERDCSLQRRHQKVIERAPAPYLSQAQREDICEAAVRIAKHAGISNASTVEFLMDSESGEFYFIEVNPRLQVEHTVTEEVTGLDIVKAQIRIAAGATIGSKESLIPCQSDIRMDGAAMQCRVTTEDPLNGFVPDYGKIIAYRSPSGPGIRLDGGTAYSGAVITHFYDSLLVKVTARGGSQREAQDRMRRALLEFRIRGVESNIPFLERLVDRPEFLEGDYTTRFIDSDTSLFEFSQRRDRSTKLLNYIAETIVNGNKLVKGRAKPERFAEPILPKIDILPEPPSGPKAIFDAQGADGFSKWLLGQEDPFVTDTTMRDAHQSLLATRMRTRDLVRIAPFYREHMSGLLSVESWGGATFDVAMRFLSEDPWDRLHQLSACMPNIMQQMLLRASNAVGYTNYPDNVVEYFVERAAEAGIDIFRIFDSLNWFDNMKVAIEAVRRTGKIAEAAICYTGDILSPRPTKYDLSYYLKLAKDCEQAGAHIIAIKDMAGLLKPAAARVLVSTLKGQLSIPIHLHTHDTSGISAATVIAAVNAGVDAFDAAIDSMSGLTSQPSLGSLVAALESVKNSADFDSDKVVELSRYFEDVRSQYVAFEASIKSGTSDVYNHEMPGGQYTNLREQATALGIGHRWSEVSKAYAEVNDMFGDIVKVTPSSKVVGDMALAMVTSGWCRDDVENPDKPIAFPESVKDFFAGGLGQPTGGFPELLRLKVLGERQPYVGRPGATLAPINLDATRSKLETVWGLGVSDDLVASHIMYPKVCEEYLSVKDTYGDLSVLPTHVFFYGLTPGYEVSIELETGRHAIIRYLTKSEVDADGLVHVFFELNGQPRTVHVRDARFVNDAPATLKADSRNANHIGAPMPGLVVGIEVAVGDRVKAGDTLLVLEAMKMQTSLRSEASGTIRAIHAESGQTVDTKDLLVEIE